MAAYGFPVLYTLFLWWFSTALILYLDGLPRRTFRWTMLGATALAIAALAGLIVSSDLATTAGAYCAFTCALIVWGWHEVGLLMGFVTGPRQTPCPADATGWRRFVMATQTVLHHELAIALTAALLVALTWGGDNQFGTLTFMVLWAMRLSAKLNLFTGVPNLAEALLPDHLRYLATYMAKRPPGLLFALSVSISTVALVLLVQAAIAADASAFEVTGLTFLATMLALAVLEHWLLVLPLPDTALWGVALRSRKTGAPAPVPPHFPLRPAMSIERRP